MIINVRLLIPKRLNVRISHVRKFQRVSVNSIIMLILIYVTGVERGNDACKIDDIKREKSAGLENMWSATILYDQVIYRMTRSICHYTNIYNNKI